MKKSDTEQEQPGLEENKVPDSQSKRELDRELQELAEKEHQEMGAWVSGLSAGASDMSAI